MTFSEETSFQEEIKKLKKRIYELEDKVKELESKLNKKENFNLKDCSFK